MLVIKNERKRRGIVPPITSLPAESIKGTATLAASYSEYPDTQAGQWRRYHRKCCHPGSEILKNTLEVNGISLKPDNHFCEPCARGKVKSHPHGHWPSSQDMNAMPGEFLKGDAEGPFASTYGGGKYRIFLKCTVSKAVISRVTSSKRVFPQALKEILIEFGCKSGRKPRQVQLDGDGTFTSDALKEMMREMRIYLMHSSPYDSWQNGFAENEVQRHDNAMRVIMEQSGALHRCGEQPPDT